MSKEEEEEDSDNDIPMQEGHPPGSTCKLYAHSMASLPVHGCGVDSVHVIAPILPPPPSFLQAYPRLPLDFPNCLPPPGFPTPAPRGSPPPLGPFPRRGAAPIAQTSGPRAPAHPAQAPPPAVPVASTATISTGAQRRDFKASTALVPASLQRRRGGIGGAGAREGRE